MTHKTLLRSALVLTLAGGTVGGTTLAAAMPVAAAQVLPATAPVTAVAMAPAAAPLTAAQMSAVQGAGIFSFFKDLFKTVKKAIAGAIVSFFTNLLKSWIEQLFGVADGGAKQNQTQTETQHYNSQADYDAGIVSSTTTEETPWVTTESWGGGGCTSDSGDGIYMDQMISAETSC